jgi:hypothetical protein
MTEKLYLLQGQPGRERLMGKWTRGQLSLDYLGVGSRLTPWYLYEPAKKTQVIKTKTKFHWQEVALRHLYLQLFLGRRNPFWGFFKPKFTAYWIWTRHFTRCWGTMDKWWLGQCSITELTAASFHVVATMNDQTAGSSSFLAIPLESLLRWVEAE